MIPKIPFYYGLGSRYSYLAATQLARIEAETSCRFEWLPLQSGELIRRANKGLSPFAGQAASGQYHWEYRRRDAEAWAKYYDVPYCEPQLSRLDPADLALACWAAEGQGRLKEMSRLIFRALFAESHVATRDLLRDLAQDLGLDGELFLQLLDDDETAAKHEKALRRALSDGVFGVPSFVVAGEMFWGNDRLLLVEKALQSAVESWSARGA